MDYCLDLPYPNLPKQDGDVDQQDYFLEPVHASPNDVGTPVILPTEASLSVPPSFGNLYRMYHKPCSARALESRLIFVRRDKGTVDHGIQRSNAAAYEKAKFNTLLYPGMDKNNDINYGKSNNWESMDDHWKSMLRLHTWPLCFRAPTLAPFMPSRHAFQLPKAEQPSWLTKMCKILEIFQMILENIFDSWETVSNLGRTCQLLFDTIDATVMHCDLTSGNFLDIDKSQSQLRAMILEGKRSQDEVENIRVSPYVIVSPVRKEFNESELSEEGRLNEYGYCNNEDMMFLQERMIWSLKHTFKLYRAMIYRPTDFRHLLLQRVPYLNIMAVKAIIRSLPNLKTIGIHNCDLMAFGQTGPLVEAIRGVNIDRAAMGKETRLAVDFYPRYFQGPIYDSAGCFGVMPMDEGGVVIPRAVVATLLHVIPMAVEAGIDLLSPGKAFRRWLDKIPFHLDTLPHILEGILNLCDFRNEVHCPMDGLPAPARRDMELTLWADIIVATKGAPMRQSELFNVLMIDGELKLKHCRDCEEDLPAYFFKGVMMGRPSRYSICHGCELAQYAEVTDQYDMRQRKNEIARQLWGLGKITDVRMLMCGLPRPGGGGGGGGGGAASGGAGPGPGRDPPATLRGAKARVRRLARVYEANQHRIAALRDAVLPDLRRRLGRQAPPHGAAAAGVERQIALAARDLAAARVRNGRGQLRLPPGEGSAASWQQLIAEYRGTLAVAGGRLANNGPYALRSTANYVRAAYGGS